MIRTLSLLVALAFTAALPASPAGAKAEEIPYEVLQERIIHTSERVKPAVVHIEAIAKINDRRRQVTGSGLIARKDGLILTNHHVVDRAEKVTVLVPGQKQKYPAQVVGSDKQTDIAVLRITPDVTLPTCEIGTSADVRVGQWVLAVGNPYGLEGTVSFGIVSAMGRNLEVEDLLNDFIQTDAMIDRGSSGGPLVDLDGRVIGINSRGQGRGIGFTIPIDTVLGVMREIEAGGVERGWLGVSVQPLDRDLADYLGLADSTGVVVNSVSANSPAEKAGIEPGDIITHVGSGAVEAEKPEDLRNFQRQVAGLEPGNKVTLTVIHDGDERSVKATIGVQPKIEPAEAESDTGFHVQEITENLFRSQRLATRKGAYVSFVERGSPAAEAELRPGDVIERIEDEDVRDLSDFRRAMEEVSGRSRFLVTARRGDETLFLLVNLRGADPVEPPEEAPSADPGHAAHSLEGVSD